MLPEKWYIRWRTQEAFQDSKDYFTKTYPKYGYEKWKNTGNERAFGSDGKYFGHYTLADVGGYVEISYEEFRKYVLNKNIEYLIYN